MQITLSAEGFRDRRSGGALIPWSSVRRAVNLGLGNSANVIELELGGDLRVGADFLTGAGNRGPGLQRVRVPLAELDTSATELLRDIRGFAPHLVD